MVFLFKKILMLKKKPPAEIKIYLGGIFSALFSLTGPN